jgi:polysaccharide deacetylase family protein (PEP-CTERM system associated)
MNNAIRVLTFDIEEWFHLLDFENTRSVSSWNKFESRIHKNVDRILELVTDKGQKATFFCLGWIAEKYPEVIRSIDEAGFEIASHSCYHQLAYELGPQQFREDIQKSIDLLQNITGKKVRIFRVPGFSITRANSWALEILVECGIEIDSSIFPAPRGHGGFEDFGTCNPVNILTPSGSLKEFPINTASFFGKQIIFSGGGYFRLLPYSVIDMLMSRSSYVMTYFHPRDFDAEQPVLEGLPFSRKFKSYHGLSGAFSKLKMLMGNYNFTDIGSIENSITWKDKDLRTGINTDKVTQH